MLQFPYKTPTIFQSNFHQHFPKLKKFNTSPNARYRNSQKLAINRDRRRPPRKKKGSKFGIRSATRRPRNKSTRAIFMKIFSLLALSLSHSRSQPTHPRTFASGGAWRGKPFKSKIRLPHVRVCMCVCDKHRVYARNYGIFIGSNEWALGRELLSLSLSLSLFVCIHIYSAQRQWRRRRERASVLYVSKRAAKMATARAALLLLLLLPRHSTARFNAVTRQQQLSFPLYFAREYVYIRARVEAAAFRWIFMQMWQCIYSNWRMEK